MSLAALNASERLDLPPGFDLLALRESGDAYAHACRVAAREGAGTLVWVRRFDVAEFAVVLEPDAPLAECRKSFFMGMNALLQAVAAHCPPDRAIAFDWPDALRFNAGLVGGGRLGWPAGCDEGDVPDWLVFGAVVRLALPGDVEPGQAPEAAALEDEGFEGAGPSVIVESFARFLMLQVDIWRSAGYGPILADYVARIARQRSGDTLSLTPNGDLRIRLAGGSADTILPLLPALAAVTWLDPATGAPRL
ncbi:MAG: hypothetical protein DI527_15600 [Chelatococcus sp.]|nr:MAG: hypothetical protein DI527_15600 [Chelatococcus sp.]